MHLDSLTVFVLLTLVTFLAGALLLWIWYLNTEVQGLKWWGIAHLIGGVGLAIMIGRDILPDRLTIDLGNALTLTAYGSLCCGARVFANRGPGYAYMLVPPLIWLALCQVDGFYGSVIARVVVFSVICCGLILATAHAFSLVGERLPARQSIVVITALHGLFFLIRAVAVPLSTSPLEAWQGLWFPLTAIESIVYIFAGAFLLLALAKSRVELGYKLASEIDFLTNVANRGGFYAKAETLLANCGSKSVPRAVLVFDLNEFKRINDCFGHQTGDRVLQIFGNTASANLRKADVLGRLGGDEFAALLTNTQEAEARDIGNRIAVKFAEAVLAENLLDFRPTVSLGIADSIDGREGLDALINRADDALYRDKSLRRS